MFLEISQNSQENTCGWLLLVLTLPVYISKHSVNSYFRILNSNILYTVPLLCFRWCFLIDFFSNSFECLIYPTIRLLFKTLTTYLLISLCSHFLHGSHKLFGWNFIDWPNVCINLELLRALYTLFSVDFHFNHVFFLEKTCVSYYAFYKRLQFLVFKIDKTASENLNEEEHRQSERRVWSLGRVILQLL